VIYRVDQNASHSKVDNQIERRQYTSGVFNQKIEADVGCIYFESGVWTIWRPATSETMRFDSTFSTRDIPWKAP